MTLIRSTAVLIACLFQIPSLHAAHLCRPDERVLESCQIGKKMASVCASAKLDLADGYVKYRFGTPASLELEFPKTRIPISQYVHRGASSGSDAGISYLGFSNGDYSYVFLLEWSKPDWRAGDFKSCDGGACESTSLVVLKGNRSISSVSCKRPEGEWISDEEARSLSIKRADEWPF
jgi:hypothetical protein